MEWMKYWNMFLRRIWTIILSVIFITGGVVGFIYLVTPVFEANCKLLYIKDPSKTMLGDMASNDMMQTLGKSDPLQALIEIIKTRPLLNRVIQVVPLLNHDKEYIKPDDLKEELEIEIVPKTNLISIAYRNKDPILAAKVINTLAKVFVEEKQNLNKTEVGEAKEILKEQIDIQKKKLDQAEAKINAFKKKSGTVSIEDETQVKIQNISTIESRLLLIDAEIKGEKAKKIEVENKINSPNAKSNSFYSYWINTLEQAKSRITELTAQKNLLQKQLLSLTYALGKLPPTATKLSELMREEMIAKEIFTNLNAQYEEFKINEAANISNVKIIEPAIISDKPVFPDKIPMIIKGFLLSLIFGLGLAILLESFSGIPRSVEEIRKSLKSNLLGVIPLFKMTPSLYYVESPSSVQSESLRFIQSNFNFRGDQSQDSTSYVVTSASSKDGKSSIAVNLASTFASQNKKTVVIDFDLRKPSFHKFFKRGFDKGVTDILTGETAVEKVIQYDGESHLSIIPSGSNHTSPSKVVSHDSMIKFIEKLKTYFEIIIIDTSPISLASETLEITKYIDGIILIVNAQKPIKPIKEIELSLTSKKLPIKGIIVNKYRTGKSVYKYYNKK